MIEEVNNVVLTYHLDYPSYIMEYCQYLIKTLRDWISRNLKLNFNISFDNHIPLQLENTYHTKYISFNVEHTLVLQGGRSVPPQCPYGNIKNIRGDQYFCRIENVNLSADYIFDYSIPNIINISSCEYYSSIHPKLIYIPALIYKGISINTERNISLLTSFINTNEPRRKSLLESFKDNNIDYINISGIYGSELENILERTKIIVNIHQTDHHHTFEELRVLPALQKGCVVISEDSPLKEYIPYYNFIIWTNYEDIIEVFKNTIENYETFHKKFFGGRELEIIMDNMRSKMIEDLNSAIK